MARRKPKRASKMNGAATPGFWQGVRANLKSIVSEVLHDPTALPPQMQRGQAPTVYQAVYQSAVGSNAPNRPPLMSSRNGDAVQDRNYSPITVNWSNKIKKMGPNVPADLRGVVDDVISGRGAYTNAQVIDIYRKTFGVERSGATSVINATRTVRRGIREASQIGMLLEMQNEGGVTGGIASAELANRAVDKITDVVTGPKAEKFFRSIADSLASNPIAGEKLFYAIGRGVRLGGAAVGAALFGNEIAQEYFGQQKGAAQARLNASGAALRLGNAELSQSVKQRVRQSVLGGRGFFRTLLDDLNFNEETEKTISDREMRQFSYIEASRKNPGAFGVNASSVIQKLADEKNIPVEALTENEIRIALDKAIEKNITVPDEAVESELKKRGFNSGSGGIVLADNEFGMAYSSEASNSFLNAKRVEIREELEQKIRREKLESLEHQVEVGVKAIETLSNDQRLKNFRDVRDGMRRGINNRKRHQVVWYD